MDNMKKRLFPLVGLLLACTGNLHAQTEVTAGVMQGKDYGVTYTLPRTEIALTLQVTKHTYTPGEFCKYADRYLHQSNVLMDAEEHWTLDDVKADVVGVPDKDKVFFVKLKDKSTAPLIELTEEGIIRSINLPYSGKKQEDNPQPAFVSVRIPDIDPNSYLTEEILMASSTAKKAELVAKEIYYIRESRNALSRGEADYMPQDGAQMKLMLDNLNRQETALTSMFTGTVVEERHTFIVRILPTEIDNALAFRFSRKMGLVDNDDLVGEPAYISIANLKSYATDDASLENGKKVAGIAYNAPGMAHVSLTYDERKMVDCELPLTQFGITEYLAPVLFNKNAPTTVLFNTATGGLIKVDRGE